MINADRTLRAHGSEVRPQTVPPRGWSYKERSTVGACSPIELASTSGW